MINFYGKIKGGNFGDDLNAYLWPALLPKPMAHYLNDDVLFLGIGTRLRPEVIPTDKKKIIFGTGYGYSKAAPVVDSSWLIKCVRGPMTAKALGIDQRYAITDSAILVKEKLAGGPQKIDVGFIPHHLTLSEDDWTQVCKPLGVTFINPKEEPLTVISKISQCRMVITESLHGAILADAYRVPWIPVASRGTINEFKWSDWASSVGLTVRFNPLPPLYNVDVRSRNHFLKYRLKQLYGKTIAVSSGKRSLEKLLVENRPVLSDEQTFANVYRRLKESFDELVDELECGNAFSK